jgi:hypothetical protein
VRTRRACDEEDGKMVANPDERPLESYRVKLGHLEVSVRCRGAQEAVRIARQQLSQDLPRLYDVIHQLEADRFRIVPER